MRTRTQHPNRPGLRSVAAAVLLGSLTLALAACGKGDDGGGSQIASLGNTATTASDGATAGDGASGANGGDGETSTTVDPEDAFLAFAQCMRDHGVDMPDPQVDDNGRGVIQVGGP